MDSRLYLRVEDNQPPILHAIGELDYGNCDVLGSVLCDLLKSEQPTIDLSLGGLDFVDSSGLRALVVAARNAKGDGKVLNVVSLSPQLDHLLEVSGFKRLFNVKQPNRISETGAGSYGPQPDMLEFELPNELQSCRTARGRVTEFATAAGFGHEALDDIRLAVGEAVSNAARHGDSSQAYISVRCRMLDHRLVITIRYPSNVFDPLEVPAPNLDDSPEGGMGIYFMNLVMDEVRYEFADEHVEVTVEKWLPGAR